MSNSYLQFSFTVPIQTEELEEWVRSILDASDFLMTGQIGGVTSGKPPSKEVVDQCYDLFPEMEDRGDVGFCWDLADGELSIYADENGDTEHVVRLLGELVTHPASDLQRVGFGYAFWCSGMEPGAFGGGAIVVSDNNGEPEINYIDTHEWLAGELQ